MCLIENNNPSFSPDHCGLTDTTARVISCMYLIFRSCKKKERIALFSPLFNSNLCSSSFGHKQRLTCEKWDCGMTSLCPEQPEVFFTERWRSTRIMDLGCNWTYIFAIYSVKQIKSENQIFQAGFIVGQHQLLHKLMHAVHLLCTDSAK